MEWITGADIWQVQLDDGENVASEPARLIGSSRLDAHPVYSPDGARIAFHSDRTGGQGIWIASASGEGAHRLELLGRGGSPLTPDPGFCWSPDQTAIVFAVEGDLHVVNVRSERSQPLTSGPVVDQSPAWSPDGRWVYYSSFQQGLWRVARVPARGGPPVQLTKDGGRLLAVSPDGLRVYFANDDQLWTIPAGGGEPVQILAVAPDAAVATERGLFYALNVPAHSIRYLDIESRTSKTVTELDRWIMGLSVSPDGRDLVYGLLDHKRADLMLVEGFE
jgi:Tol biopolymer transport system component